MAQAMWSPYPSSLVRRPAEIHRSQHLRPRDTKVLVLVVQRGR